jgi:hypothetical protein
MISSGLSLVFGILSLVVPLPVLLPVIGLGLGANGFIKEGKKEEQNKTIKLLAIIGIVCCGISVILFFANRS